MIRHMSTAQVSKNYQIDNLGDSTKQPFALHEENQHNEAGKDKCKDKELCASHLRFVPGDAKGQCVMCEVGKKMNATGDHYEQACVDVLNANPIIISVIIIHMDLILIRIVHQLIWGCIDSKCTKYASIIQGCGQNNNETCQDYNATDALCGQVCRAVADYVSTKQKSISDYNIIPADDKLTCEPCPEGFMTDSSLRGIRARYQKCERTMPHNLSV